MIVKHIKNSHRCARQKTEAVKTEWQQEERENTEQKGQREVQTDQN